jgi:hypothetical protein
VKEDEGATLSMRPKKVFKEIISATCGTRTREMRKDWSCVSLCCRNSGSVWSVAGRDQKQSESKRDRNRRRDSGT